MKTAKGEKYVPPYKAIFSTGSKGIICDQCKCEELCLRTENGQAVIVCCHCKKKWPAKNYEWGLLEAQK